MSNRPKKLAPTLPAQEPQPTGIELLNAAGEIIATIPMPDQWKAEPVAVETDDGSGFEMALIVRYEGCVKTRKAY